MTSCCFSHAIISMGKGDHFSMMHERISLDFRLLLKSILKGNHSALLGTLVWAPATTWRYYLFVLPLWQQHPKRAHVHSCKQPGPFQRLGKKEKLSFPFNSLSSIKEQWMPPWHLAHSIFFSALHAAKPPSMPCCRSRGFFVFFFFLLLRLLFAGCRQSGAPVHGVPARAPLSPGIGSRPPFRSSCNLVVMPPATRLDSESSCHWAAWVAELAGRKHRSAMLRRWRR